MNGIKLDPDIKQDPDTMASPSGFMDDDIYEDTGELNMPSRTSADGINLWLTRIPKWLWDSLANAGDDDEVEIGEVAFFPDAQGQPQKDRPMRMVMSEQWQQAASQKHKQTFPRAYEFGKPENEKKKIEPTYVFNEKDLPGYRPMAYGRSRPDMGGVQDPKARIQKQKQKFRKAIPKHTSLVGAPSHEYNVTAIPNDEYRSFSAKRNREAIVGKQEAPNIVNSDTIDTTNSAAAFRFKGFVRTGMPTRRQENKAARMPKNELLDLLQGMFDRYEYWPMKEIKRETRQPEAYLKETLSEIADLVKSGPFASCWKRHSEFSRGALDIVHGKPPEVEGEGDDGLIDEDDDNMEMEDVV